MHHGQPGEVVAIVERMRSSAPVARTIAAYPTAHFVVVSWFRIQALPRASASSLVNVCAAGGQLERAFAVASLSPPRRPR
jgi:hypothetical protein